MSPVEANDTTERRPTSWLNCARDPKSTPPSSLPAKGSIPLLIPRSPSSWDVPGRGLRHSDRLCRNERFRSESSAVRDHVGGADSLLSRAAGREVGPALLFYGCHSPDTDLLYDAEMAEWQRQGVVEVRHAFSKAPELSLGCKHVQYVPS